VRVGAEGLMVADLVDIIASKRAADRPRDRAVMDALEQTLKQKSDEGPGVSGTKAAE
jgi:hypothetical protein